MNRKGTPASIAALATFLLALMLEIVPLPDELRPFRPLWLPMVFIFWSVTAPARFSLGSAWLLGLLLDVLTGTLLGQHALAMSVVALLAQKSYLQIRVYPIWQMALAVFAILAVYIFLLMWIDGVSGRTVPQFQRWMPLVSSTLLWPVIYGALWQLARPSRSSRTPL